MALLRKAVSLEESNILSDSDLKQIDNIKPKKNKSNLFLIKSYSFIDKNSHKNNKIQNGNSKETFVNKKTVNTINALMLESNKNVALHVSKMNNKNNNNKAANTKNEKQNSKKKSNKKFYKLNKNSEKSDINELNKNSRSNSDDFNELKDLLRKPLKSEQQVLKEKIKSEKDQISSKRPKSLPLNVNNNVAVVAANNRSSLHAKNISCVDNNDDDDDNYDSKKLPVALKRESFLRQSFQSIRRSLTSYKRYANIQHGPVSSHYNSSFSTTSSSTSSTSSSPSNLQNSATIYLRKQTEGSAKIFESSPLTGELNEMKVDVVILLNDNLTPLDLSETIESTKNSVKLLNAPQADGNSQQKPVDDKRSTSSVSTLSYTQSDINSMAPLQNRADAQSDLCLNTFDKKESNPTKQELPNNQKRPYCQQFSLPESIPSDYSIATNSTAIGSFNNSTTLGNSKSEAKSLRQSSNSLNPLVPVSSASSIRSLSSNNSSTAKNDQNSTAAVSNTAAAIPSAAEKEKKRKEVSSSRVKKFHRHFSQVSKDEKLINYFSCALVSDILLQGHLYITDQHFAFYSNVFGYVTKVVIPTSSVTKISKEKTAKIIPNAVGVATADERHVFGSFISREAAFRLMCSVCSPMAPTGEIIVKSPAEIEICEEYSIEDDSSCSISGNESPPQLASGAAKTEPVDSNSLRNPTNENNETADEVRRIIEDIPPLAKDNLTAIAFSNRNPSPVTVISAVTARLFGGSPSQGEFELKNRAKRDPEQKASANSINNGPLHSSNSDSTTPSTSSELTQIPSTYSENCVDRFFAKVRSKASQTKSYFNSITELQLIYIGIGLAVILSFFSLFLLYRVINIEAKANLYGSPIHYPFHNGNDEDIFKEALRWQKELEKKSTEEAQTILSKNLEQISKVRRSLETLSTLIHDRTTGFKKSESKICD